MVTKTQFLRQNCKHESLMGKRDTETRIWLSYVGKTVSFKKFSNAFFMCASKNIYKPLFFFLEEIVIVVIEQTDYILLLLCSKCMWIYFVYLKFSIPMTSNWKKNIPFYMLDTKALCLHDRSFELGIHMW